MPTTKETMKLTKAAFLVMDGEHKHIQFTEEEGKPKFEMTVYSGGIIKGHWWWGDLAIDLKGLKFTKQLYPILEGHDTNRKIGFTKKPRVEDNSLKVGPKGVELVDTEEAQQFVKLSKQGFPYEASLYAIPKSIERLEEGASAEVNGYMLKGPGTVWREAIFKEASVCVFGYDTNTKAAAFDHKEELEVTLEVKSESDHCSPCGDANSKEGGMKIMELSELKAKHPDLVDAIQAEVTEQLTGEFAKDKTALEGKVTELEAKIQQKDQTISSQEERVLKLEKAEAIRQENDRRAFADRIWNDKLEASDIPEHLYSKVMSQVSYTKFVGDGKFDTEAFSQAIATEIEDWIGRGVTKTVIGGGGPTKQVVDTKQDKLAQEDDAAVEQMLAMAGDPSVRKN